MTINDMKCEVCGEELAVDTYYYIATGRLAQGVQSDPKAYKEYTLCNDCYTKLNTELLVSLRKAKTRQAEKKKQE